MLRATERHGVDRFYLIGDEDRMRVALGALQAAGLRARRFDSVQRFLDVASRLAAGGVIVDLDMDLETDMIARIAGRKAVSFVIGQTATADVPLAVAAVRNGAADVLVHPYEPAELMRAIRECGRLTDVAPVEEIEHPGFGRLSDREREVLDRLARGMTNKGIALDLGISHRTVEVHRARLMRKLGAATLPEALEVAFRHRMSQ